MKRRNFLKKIPMLAGASFALNNIPVRVMSQHSHFLRLAEQSDNDRVMVIIQLHGGNDGLNAVIPVEQYDLYYSRRANIAIPAKNSVRRYIPLDSTLPGPDQVGLHPDMIGAKDLYDRGRLAIVQGVSYPNNNGSHFRGRDIWYMGGGFDDYYSSGWVGRYLQNHYLPQVYPNDFPNDDMLDPLAIEIGSDVSLLFHQHGNIPTSISLPGSPEGFANLVESLEGFHDKQVDPRGKPPESLNDSPYGKELNWILGLEEKSEDYAARLWDVYRNSAATSVAYPEIYPFNAPSGSLSNRLTPQLQLVARLISGGAKTKVYLVRIGGFDTHADQVESYNSTMGMHAALMYHLTSAMNAFQADLKARGIEDRVVSVTTSEFGRRIDSNGSFGTDHGTGGPLFIFGKYVNPGVIGTNHDLSTGSGNIAMQYDYRQIFANLLKDWMKVDEQVVNNDIFFGNFINGAKEDGSGSYEPLPLITDSVTGTESFFRDRFRLENAYPNPAKGHTNMSFYINTENHVSLKLMDQKGSTVRWILREKRHPGEHRIKVDLSGLKAGIYFYQIEAGLLKDTKKLIITD
ncbi:hypothetical protein C900_01376 [Fulvivirga imtechensis AK7]|uniref:Secretion system C-terminal sorting domain-containing protein n=1 Tax=Fulvivirga imtechensis AK7 TaxID=1237149 RepID=L8JXK0_9BACT|nr:DUF1501 domain-containing protein [Fulvivirga imtechensis]ELR73766.1 hypothetical protein C900_01376 [Fulvivirga imtechensis AK7]